jgi:hypothetical protein
MLTCPMLSSHSSQPPSLSPGVFSLRNSSSRHCKCGASAPPVFSNFVFSSKLFGIRTSKKHASNSRRIRSFKTQDLKLFRMCSYRKNQGGGGLIVNQKSDKGFLSRTTIGSEGPLFLSHKDCSAEEQRNDGLSFHPSINRRFRPCRKGFLFQVASLRDIGPIATSLLLYVAASPNQPKPAPSIHYSLFTTHFPTRLTKLGASFNVKCLSDT